MTKKPTTALFRRRPPYITSYGEWLESPAYRHLSLTARCLLMEFQIIYRTGRNGRLVLPVLRAAERLNCSEKTVSKAYCELMIHGFIDINAEASYSNGKAREWTLLIEPFGSGREPLDTWRAWVDDQNKK